MNPTAQEDIVRNRVQPVVVSLVLIGLVLPACGGSDKKGAACEEADKYMDEDCQVYPREYLTCGSGQACEANCALDAPCEAFLCGGEASCVDAENEYWACVDGCYDGCSDTTTCEECFQCAVTGACKGVHDACADDATCVTLEGCIGDCSPTDTTCISACATDYPEGLDLYEEYAECVNCNSCPTQCDDPYCY